ncbi:MAG: hypothetical protein Q7R40_17480 [Phaeospirillum sp.]|nr:hypothetical protein [Phaeospirillum sp.]
MATLSIPVRLALAELSAAALMETAAGLAAASDHQAFIAALEDNHQLWRTLVGVAHQQSWSAPDAHQAEFVMTVSRKCGLGVCDNHVEALIGINHRVSSQLAGGADLGRIAHRANSTWHETGLAESVSFSHWLMEEILRKARHNAAFPPPEAPLAAAS